MTDKTLTSIVKVRTVRAGLQAYIEHHTKKGNLQASTLSEQILSKELAQSFDVSPKELEGLEVAYLLEGGKVKKVWEKGKVWESSEDQQCAENARGQDGSKYFENPYNFIPALPRITCHPELGDALPTGHHRWSPDRWSGRICVVMEVCTPLLIPDLISEADDHKTFGVRIDESGMPYLPPTSIKGALRTAYEAITNSRMGVFTGHGDPLAYRGATNMGMRVVPAVVTQGGTRIQLQPGISRISDDGAPDARMQYAAWLPQYRGKETLLQYGQNHVKHGAKVWARLEHWKHFVYEKNKSQWNCDFTFLRVIAIFPDAAQVPAIKVNNSRPVHPPRVVPNKRNTYSAPEGGKQSFWQQGRICISGENITNKHDERLFFIGDAHPQKAEIDIPIADQVRRRWRTLITNYQAEHGEETKNGRYDLSRHITGGKTERELKDGTLCYASLRRCDECSFELLALYPVQISRDLYDVAPEELLDNTLISAKHLKELSPADRVFGWVSADGEGSHKGQLRIGTALCSQGASAIKPVGGDRGVPLAILGQPKPAQARFYAAINQQGEPLSASANKQSGYRSRGGLRGRKVYPHHRQAALVKDYWDSGEQASNPLLFNGSTVYREWLSHDKERTSQNRSLTAWVKPGTRFSVPIDVYNLSAVEVGALLWLLHLDTKGYLRIGGGKPLGFGSMRVSVQALDLRDGEAVRADYYSFGQRGSAGDRVSSLAQASHLIKSYCTALPQAVNATEQQFDQLPIIRAFINAATGGNTPVHYPRTNNQQGPQGENFKWFVANEKIIRGVSPGHSLPELWAISRGFPKL